MDERVALRQAYQIGYVKGALGRIVSFARDGTPRSEEILVQAQEALAMLDDDGEAEKYVARRFPCLA